MAKCFIQRNAKKHIIFATRIDEGGILIQAILHERMDIIHRLKERLT